MLATAFTTEADHAVSMRLPRASTVKSDPLSKRLSMGIGKIFEAKEHIFRDGDAASNIYLVEAGHVCIYKMMGDGRRQVLDFAYPGDLIGLGAIGDHTTYAQTMSRTRVRALPVTALDQLAREDAGLGRKLYETLSKELTAAREMLFTVSQRTAPERVAAFLIALSRRAERNGEDASEFVLPMTRADIADFLGLTIETVSRTFTRFRTEGLIDLAQCVLVTILEHDALSELAEGRSH